MKDDFALNSIFKQVMANSKIPNPAFKPPALIIYNFATKTLSLQQLKYVPYIYHLMQFKKNQAKVQTLINSGSEINAMTLAYVAKLGFKISKSNIKVQKINSSLFKTFKIVLTSFQKKDKLGNAQFFEEMFLVAKTSIEIILCIFFLIFYNAIILFIEQELIWISYIPAEASSTTQQVQINSQKEFVAVATNLNKKAFLVHMIYLYLKILIYPVCETQITFLVIKKMTILAKYSDYLKIFLKSQLLSCPKALISTSI